jgi:hypothetical protein
MCDHRTNMRFVLAIFLAAGLAAAQSPTPSPTNSGKSDWASVKRLAAGEDIRVSMTDGKSFRGQLQSSTDDSLIIIVANTQQTLARAEISKIATKGNSHRGRNTLIGLGVGAGAGLAIGAGVDHSCAPHDCFIGNNLGKEAFTPVGAFIGAIVGVAWPTGRWHDVYRSK